VVRAEDNRVFIDADAVSDFSSRLKRPAAVSGRPVDGVENPFLIADENRVGCDGWGSLEPRDEGLGVFLLPGNVAPDLRTLVAVDTEKLAVERADIDMIADDGRG